MKGTSLGYENSNTCMKDLGVLVNHKLNRSQPCNAAAKNANAILWCINRNTFIFIHKKAPSHPTLRWSGSTLNSGSSSWPHTEKQARVQKRVTQMVRWLETKTYEEPLRNQICLEQKIGLGGTDATNQQTTKWLSQRRKGARLFSFALEGRMGTSGLKLQVKNLLIVRTVYHWRYSDRSWRVICLKCIGDWSSCTK